MHILYVQVKVTPGYEWLVTLHAMTKALLTASLHILRTGQGIVKSSTLNFGITSTHNILDMRQLNIRKCSYPLRAGPSLGPCRL